MSFEKTVRIGRVTSKQVSGILEELGATYVTDYEQHAQRGPKEGGGTWYGDTRTFIHHLCGMTVSTWLHDRAYGDNVDQRDPPYTGLVFIFGNSGRRTEKLERDLVAKVAALTNVTSATQ